MPGDTSFTLRVPARLYRRVFDVIAATENEVTRTDLFLQAMEQLLAQLEACPAMVKNYDPSRDKSARRLKRAQGKNEE